jgi:DNA modification methylase
MPDKSVDLVLTDPPYEFESKNPAGGGFMDKENKQHLHNIGDSFGFNFDPKLLLAATQKVCKKFNAYVFTNKTLVPEYLDFIRANKYKWDLLLWSKPNPIPIFNAHYLIDKEYIIYAKESGAFFGNTKEYGKYFTIKSYPVFQGKSGHPTEKPLELIKEIIEVSTKTGDTILDPFMGSGTTGVACKLLNRNFIGIEISKKYFDLAKNRIDQTEEGLFK